MAQVGFESLTEVWTPPIPTQSSEAVRVGVECVTLSGRVAAELGCPLIVQTGGPRIAEGLAKTIEGLRILQDSLADVPVQVCLEPHMNSQILYPEDYHEILAALDPVKFGITVDTGHFHTAGVDWEAFIRQYPDRVYNVHLKDHRGAQSVPIGTGEIDLARLVGVLNEVGYDGPLALEMELEDPQNAPQYVADAFQYLSNLLTG